MFEFMIIVAVSMKILTTTASFNNNNQQGPCGSGVGHTFAFCWSVWIRLKILQNHVSKCLNLSVSLLSNLTWPPRRHVVMSHNHILTIHRLNWITLTEEKHKCNKDHTLLISWMEPSIHIFHAPFEIVYHLFYATL